MGRHHPLYCPIGTYDVADGATVIPPNRLPEFDHPDGRHVGFAQHHPLITAGPHGGHYTWKQHVFPLMDFWPNAWIPLPIIGSSVD